MITSVLTQWARQFEIATCLVVFAVILFPVYFKRLFRFNDKVLHIEYGYFPIPFKIMSFALHYKFSKNVTLVTTASSIIVRKKPNEFRLSIYIPDMHLHYNAQQPVKIGQDLEADSLYKERVAHLLKQYFTRPPLYPSGFLTRCNTALKAAVTYFLTFLLSFVEIHWGSFTIEPPILYHETSQQRFPPLIVSCRNLSATFKFNQEGNIEWTFASAEAVKCSTKDTNLQIIDWKGFVFSGSTQLALNIDLMFQNAKLDIQASQLAFTFTNRTLFMTDIIWNEVYCTPSIQRCLKQLLCNKRFLKIGHPQFIRFRFDSLVYTYALSDSLRYRKDFNHFNEEVQFFAENLVWTYDFKFPVIDGKRYKHNSWSIQCSENGMRFKGPAVKKNQILTFFNYRLKCDTTMVFSSAIEKHDLTNMSIEYDLQVLIISPKFLRYIQLFGSHLYDSVRANYELKQLEKDAHKNRRKYFLEQAYDIMKGSDRPMPADINQNNIFNIHYKCNQGLHVEILNIQNDPIIYGVFEGFEHKEEEHESTRSLAFKFRSLQMGNQTVMNHGYVRDFTAKKQGYEQCDFLLDLGQIDLTLNEHQLADILKLQQNIALYKASLNRTSEVTQTEQLVSLPVKYSYQISAKNSSIGFRCKDRMLVFSIEHLHCVEADHMCLTNFMVTDCSSSSRSTFFCIDMITWQKQDVEGKLQIEQADEEIVVAVKSIKITLDENIKDLSYYRRVLAELSPAQNQSSQKFDEPEPLKRRVSADDTCLSRKAEVESWAKPKSVAMTTCRMSIRVGAISLAIQDSIMNRHILRYREFQTILQSGKLPEYMRPIDIFSQLTPRSLLTVNLKDISLLINHNDQYNSMQQVIDEIFKLDSHPIDLDPSFFKMITLMLTSISISRAWVSVRDYPNDPLEIRDITLGCSTIITQLNTRNVGLSLRVYYDLGLRFTSLNCFLGLNLIFAGRELQKRIAEIFGRAPQKSIGHKAMRSKFVNLQELNFWDRLRLKFHGRVTVQNDKVTLSMSTDTMPYSNECVQTKCRNNYLMYQNGALKAQFNRITLNRRPKRTDETSVFNIPKVQVLGELLWHPKRDQFDHYFVLSRPYLNKLNYSLVDFTSKKFQCLLKVDCIENPETFLPERSLKKNLKQHLYFHYQTSFFKWIKQLPILRNEILRLYNIQLGSKPKEEAQTPDQQEEIESEDKKMKFLLEKKHMLNYANYFSLLSYTYNRVIESLRIQGSLYQHAENLQFKIFGHQCRYGHPNYKIRFLFSNNEKRLKQIDDYLPFKGEEFTGIQFLLENVQSQLKLIPHQNEIMEWTFKEDSFVIKMAQITGAVFNGKVVLHPNQVPDSQPSFLEFFQMQDAMESIEISSSLLNNSAQIRAMTDFSEIKHYLRSKKGNFIADISAYPAKQYHLFDDIADVGINLSSLLMSHKSSEKQQEEHHEDKNEFNAFAKFLQAQDIQYEMNKRVELGVRDNVDEEREVELQPLVKQIRNFFTIKNCKFLFTFQLQELIISVFEDVTQMNKEETKPVQDIYGKKNESSIMDSINQFVRSVADQKKTEQPTPEKAKNAWGVVRERAQQLTVKPAAKTAESILLLVNLIKPQFNLQYHGANSQMVLTSPHDCQFIMSEFTLPFDKFSIDKKRLSRMVFNGLECYILNWMLDAKTKVRWLERKGFEKIIHSDYATFMYQDFTLKESEIDFTESYQKQLEAKSTGTKVKQLWNQEMRREVLSVKVGSLFSDLNAHQFDAFNNMLDFVEMATISTQEFEDMERSYRHKVQELEYHGARNIEALIKKRLGENQDKYGTEKSRLDYHIKSAMVQLLDDSNISFLHCKFVTIRVVETFYNNESRKSDILVQRVEIVNRMTLGADASEFRSVLQQISNSNDKKMPIFRMVKKYFAIPLYSTQSRWFVYDQYDLKVNPLIIKLTDELYDKFYSYFFDKEAEKDKSPSLLQQVERYGKEKDKIKIISQNYKQRIPDFYQNIQVGELRLNVTFRHPSKLKRLKDVGVLIDPYVISKSTFWTPQELFDDFAAFIIKQVSSQIFSILGQKIFGISREFNTPTN